jgi:hypothetical protein
VRNPIGGRLERAADAEDDASQHDGLAAANLLSDQEGDDGAEEASDFVDGDNGTLEGCTASGAGRGVDLGKLRGESMSSQETGHYTLVVAETGDEELAGVLVALFNRTEGEENISKARMTYSRKPAPAAAVIAQCKGLPVRIVMLKNQRVQLEQYGEMEWRLVL